MTLLPMEATFTPGFVLLLAGVGFLSLLIFLLFLLLCQRAFKHKQGYQLPSLRVRTRDPPPFPPKGSVFPPFTVYLCTLAERKRDSTVIVGREWMDGYIDSSNAVCARSFTQKESIDLQKLRDNSTYQCVGARIDPSLEKLEYPRNDIIYIRDIGQGAFGRVFQVSQLYTVILYDIRRSHEKSRAFSGGLSLPCFPLSRLRHLVFHSFLGESS